MRVWSEPQKILPNRQERKESMKLWLLPLIVITFSLIFVAVMSLIAPEWKTFIILLFLTIDTIFVIRVWYLHGDGERGILIFI